MRALFLPYGNVGRGTWWLIQIITFAFAFLFISRAGTPVWQDMTAIASGHHVSAQVIVEHQSENVAALELFMQSGEGRSWAFAFVALMWVGVMVEINRWHDRGMSGFWVLLRLVPSLLATGSPGASVIVLVVSGFQIIQLGFLGSEYSPPPPRRDWREPLPWWKGKSPMPFIAILVGVGFVGFIAYRSAHQPASMTSVDSVPTSEFQSPAPSSTPETPHDAPTAMSPVSAMLPESAYHGTTDTNFGKDWVVLNGVKIPGIAAVIVMTGAQVSILNANGGKTVPAAKLPQGFLDEWKVTPARLKTENAL